MSDCCDYNFNISTSSGTIEDTGWENCVILMTRAFLGDLGTPPTYTDERLLQIIQIAAYFTASDLVCCSTVSKPDINICGTLASSPLEHPSFTNLMVLKAVCMIDQAGLRIKAAMDGIRATAGPATLQVMSSSPSYALLFSQGACAAYNSLKEDLCWRCVINSGIGAGQILGPFVGICSGTNTGYTPGGTCCEGGENWSQAEW